MAPYRANKWEAAKDALATSQELCRGGDASNCLLLAMTHRQLGDKDASERFYKEAVQRLNKGAHADGELVRLQGEAAGLLGGVPEALCRLGRSDRCWAGEPA